VKVRRKLTAAEAAPVARDGAVELAELDRLHRAVGEDRDELATEQRRVESEQREKLSQLAADLGLGRLTAEEYEATKSKMETEATESRRALERAEAAHVALGERAAGLAEQLARERVREAVVTAEAAESALALAREAVVTAEAALEDAEATVERAGLGLKFARAPYDPTVARAASADASREGELVRWHSRNGTLPGELPLHLREAVEQERANLVREREAERTRSRAAAVASWEALGMSRHEAEQAALTRG